jgi:hypothetical protein
MQVLGKEAEMTGLRRIAISSALLVAVSFAAGGPAVAKTGTAPPVYNEATKSYFMLTYTRGMDGKSSWRKARAFVRSLTFHGVRGTLATADSARRMMFIRDNFEIKHSTWIGGRVICKGSKLLWENGNIQKKGGYSRWHRQWNRTWIKCPLVQYMPLFLTPENQGFYWRASGPRKSFNPVMVEFRTGKP